MGYNGTNTTISANGTDVSPSSNLYETALSGVCAGILVYLSLCQIAVFIFRVKYRELSLRVQKWNDLLTASNLPCLMSVVLIVSAILGACYVIMSITARHVPFYRPLYSALVCCLMLSFLAMYMVLWLRQTSFYTEPAIKHLTYPLARYISLFHGFYILAGSVAFTVIQVVEVYKHTCVKPGCIARWVSMAITGSQLEIQLALLALFVWPLIKHRQNLGKVSSKDRRLMNLVRRAVVITVLSIIIDMASIGLYFVLKTGTVYNVATVLNLVCTIFCFGDYKARMMPCFITRQAERRASQSSIRTRESSLSRADTMRLRADTALVEEAT